MRNLSLVVAAAISAGCAGVAAGRRQPGTLSAGAFAPARPPAASYGEDPQHPCPGDATLASLSADLPAGTTADGRLCAAAEALLGWNGDEVPERVAAFVGTYFGLTAPPGRVLLATIDTADATQLAERLREPLAAFAKGAARPRFGVSTTHLTSTTERSGVGRPRRASRSSSRIRLSSSRRSRAGWRRAGTRRSPCEEPWRTRSRFVIPPVASSSFRW